MSTKEDQISVMGYEAGGDACAPRNKPKHLVLLCVAIFLFSFDIRMLTWQDNRPNAWKVQTTVTVGYKNSARHLVKGDFNSFVSDVSIMGHPPGYPILLALVYRVSGESDWILQFVQLTIDSASVVLLFLITLELFPLSVAILSALLASLSPQFAYFPTLLLPDSLVVFPTLLAVYLIVRSREKYSPPNLLVAGALIGLSCWLRANALLLPLFLAVLASLLVKKNRRVSAAIAVIAGAILLIAPITIKNAIVFHRFIPLSLGAGQTLLEGIADYDEYSNFGIPKTDLELIRQEAKWYGKPEYAEGLFDVDGIDRDRMRVTRGLSVIRSHPIWFAGVVGKRALASTRLDPVPVLLPESPVSHSLNIKTATKIWNKGGNELLRSAQTSPKATYTTGNDDWIKIDADENKYGNQFASEFIRVERFHDYVLTLPFKLESGRSLIKILSNQNRLLASTVVDLTEGVPASNQKVDELAIQFVSANNTNVQFVIANNASVHSTILIGRPQMFDLGASSRTWLRFVRIPIGIAQQFFKTAWLLPLALLGTILLLLRKQTKVLAVLWTVPAYYLIIQSAVHTERRYVYVIHFFFLIMVSLVLCWLVGLLKSKMTSRSR